MGSRFLPATKALPKELLPIVDKPIIQHIVEEAVKANLDTVIFITSRAKVSIADHFDPYDLNAYRLEAANKKHLIDEVIELSKKINVVSVRQYEALGLGHAVLCAEPVIDKNEAFAVILGDDIIDNPGGPSAISQCMEAVSKHNEKCSAVGVLQVPESEVDKYGIVGMNEEGLVTQFVEKPSAKDAPSNWALPGRYIFQSEIFEYIKNTKPGRGNEIQLTDAMSNMLKENPYLAVKMQGERFDTGDKLGYIKANVQFALKDKKFSEELKKWLDEKIR